MIRQSLLKGPAANTTFTGLRDPQREARLEEFPKPINAVVLGMGSDGHTASLFPGQPDLSEILASTNHSEWVKRPGKELDRITLTPSFLLNSNIVVLLFFGAEKWAVYEAAKVGRDTSQYPVRCILNQEDVPVYTYWAP
jgi:6-phosphogluconolactonase